MILMKFATEVKGESTVASHENWITVDSIQLGVGRSITQVGGGGDRETSNPSFSEATFTKSTDVASAELFMQAIMAFFFRDDFHLAVQACNQRSRDFYSLVGAGTVGHYVERISGIASCLFAGVNIEVEDGKFHFDILSFDSSDEGKYQPFSGDCVIGGRRFKIEPRSTEQEVVELFGEPTERDEDEGVLDTLHYEIGGCGYDFEFDEDGKLEEVYVVGR
ncbi:MAG: type VI secretion system tube protein Hcp [Planctomycetales bacterium]